MRAPQTKPYSRLAAFTAMLTLPFFAFADSDQRVWTRLNGERFTASLLSFDADSQMVTLRHRSETPYSLEMGELSTMDQAWIKESAAMEKEFAELRQSLPGKFDHFQVQGQYLTDVYVYYPSIHATKPGLPLLILFHPNGKGGAFINRFVRVAEELGIILLAPNAFKNTFEDSAEKEFDTRFLELRAAIETEVPHDAAKVLMGGISGGAARAFYNSVKFPGPWAGIWSNGGWLGPKKEDYDRPYPAGMRVAIINGHLDTAANHFVERDRKVLEARGCTVKSFSFEGGHQVPPEFHQELSLRWLLGMEEEPATSP